MNKLSLFFGLVIRRLGILGIISFLIAGVNLGQEYVCGKVLLPS